MGFKLLLILGLKFQPLPGRMVFKFIPVRFKPLRFNALYQFTPLLNLRSLFRFSAFWLAAFC